jgi:hypothetical protein
MLLSSALNGPFGATSTPSLVWSKPTGSMLSTRISVPVLNDTASLNR